MPKFHKGDLVAIVPRRLGAEVIDPEPAQGLVRVRIATIDLRTGKTSVRDENVPENELEPMRERKGKTVTGRTRRSRSTAEPEMYLRKHISAPLYNPEYT